GLFDVSIGLTARHCKLARQRQGSLPHALPSREQLWAALRRSAFCASVDRDICHVNITFEAQIKHTTRTIERNHAIKAEVTFCVRGVISPLLSNLYLNEVDKMLERAREVTRNGKYTNVEYARFADDLVVLIHAYKRHDWLIGAVNKRLPEEFAKLQVEINGEKSRRVDLERGENFGFLGFDFRYLRGLRGVMRPHYTPKLKKRTALLREVKEVFRRHRS